MLPNKGIPASCWHNHGMTLLEVMIAMFIFLVGIVGVLAAIPSGINSAEWVIFQDASIHLAHSKFAEFRRDRVDPSTDLVPGSVYLTKHGTARSGGWRDFYYINPADALQFDNEAYKYFDDIQRYEWRYDVKNQPAGTSGPDNPKPALGFLAPVSSAGTDIGLFRIAMIIRLKGTSREFRFSQFFVKYI